MTCPNCGKEVNADNNYCNYCGNAIYGPRNINLNTPGEIKKTKKNNNIESITGIDINNIARTIEMPPQPKKSFFNKIADQLSKIHIKISKSSLIFISIIIALVALCIYFIVTNNTLRSDIKVIQNIKCPKTVQECNEGLFGLTGNYQFKLLQGWNYRETGNLTIIYKDNISIIVYPEETGQINQIAAESLSKEYINEGFTDAKTSEDMLDGHKTMFVTFTAGGFNFVDFYYQTDDNNIVYGEVSSSQINDLITYDIKDIISSLTISKRDNTLINRAPVTYENVFGLIK